MEEKEKEILDGQIAHEMLTKGKIGSEYIKAFKKIVPNTNKAVDLLALAVPNDPFNATPMKKERGEWFKELWIKEGSPIIHLRALHYRIVGKGYKYTLYNKQKKPYQETYHNTEDAWSFIMEAYKFARYFNLMPYDLLPDEKNPEPTVFYSAYDCKQDELNTKTQIRTKTGYYNSNCLINEDDIDSFIDNCVDEMTNDLFERISYSHIKLQPNYVEIWAEKSGIIPRNIAKKYNATMRPAGGGEFSLTMCADAIKKAKLRNKTLHVFILSDYDPKGVDMPKSVARKIEIIARQQNTIAFVHYIGLSKEQCVKYDLPTTPAKKSKGKGYNTQVDTFVEKAGQNPTEINSFEGLYPNEYAQLIENAISPYYDLELEEKTNDATTELRNDVSTLISNEMEARKEAIEEKRNKLIEVVEKMNEFIKEKEIELDLETIATEYKETLNIDLETVLEGVDIFLPEPKIEDPINALLDTRRSYLKQIQYYKNFDIRSS